MRQGNMKSFLQDRRIYYIFLYAFICLTNLPCSYQQSNSTVVLPNTDIGPCTCDLTPSSCDVSCCCDPDCSSTDRNTFSTCIDAYNFADSQSCFPTSLFFRNNTPYKVNTASPNLFCIYNDNYVARNYYNVPTLVANSTEANNIMKTYPKWSYPKSVYGYSYTYTATFTDFYKSNDPIYILFPSIAIGKLSLPFAQGSGFCGFDNPVRFLKDRSSVCSRSVAKLNETCSATKEWNVDMFVTGFKVAFNPSLFKSVLNMSNVSQNLTLSVIYNDTGLIPITVSATCEDASGNTVACNTTSTALSPVYNASSSTCDRVLKSLKLNVFYNGTNGIRSIQAVVVLITLTDTTTTFVQTFAIAFQQDGKTPGVVRSGNPGYLLNRQVVAGRLNTSGTAQTILLAADPNQWLTVPSGGNCENPTRSPVRFGVGTSSGCLLTIDKAVTDNCQRYQRIIYSALRGASPPDRIATFGNSAPDKVGDWVTLLSSSDINPTSGVGICNQMVTGASLTIIFARVGALSNPQNKIIGAQMAFVTGSIQYACTEFNCQPGVAATTQTVPISIDVNFVDASTTPVVAEKDKPVFLARLPYDFFYPFYVENGARTSEMSWILSSTCCLLVTLFFNL